MNFRMIVTCLAGAPLLIAAAPQPVRLQPSGNWIVDYAENSCRLIREFGEGNDKTLLMFESEGPGQMDMLAVGKHLDAAEISVPAKFLPVQGKPLPGGPARSTDGRPAVLWPTVQFLPDPLTAELEKSEAEAKLKRGVRPPPADLAKRSEARAVRQAYAAAATELEIDARHARPLILETGSLGEPIKSFDQCTRDSLRDWGVDPDLEDKIARPVWTADASRWFTSSDYPPGMAIQGKESEVSVRLLVDASGMPTQCTSLSHFDEPAFNKIVCTKFMSRAKFEPAELADGTKVASYYVNRIVFRIAP